MPILLDGDRIRAELGRRGLTQAQFAAMCGMHAPQLSRALNGRPVLPRNLERIGRALADVRLIAGADLVKGPEG
jgi:transcriptional regulator with XRE-family HTH domain